MDSTYIQLFQDLLSGNQNVWLILVIGLGIWLFREIRMYQTKVLDTLPARIEKSLTVYGNIEYILDTHDGDPAIELKLKEYISANYAYISRQFYLQWERYNENKSVEEKSRLVILLKEEIGSLQLQITSKVDTFDTQEIKSYFRLSGLLYTAFMTTFFLIFVIMAILALILFLVDDQVSTCEKVIVCGIVLSSILFTWFIASLINYMFEKRIEFSMDSVLKILIVLVSYSLVFTSYYSIPYSIGIVYFIFSHYRKMIKTQHQAYLDRELKYKNQKQSNSKANTN